MTEQNVEAVYMAVLLTHYLGARLAAKECKVAKDVLWKWRHGAVPTPKKFEQLRSAYYAYFENGVPVRQRPDSASDAARKGVERQLPSSDTRGVPVEPT